MSKPVLHPFTRTPTFVAHVYDNIMFRTEEHEFSAQDTHTIEDALPVASFMFAGPHKRVTKVVLKEEKVHEAH